MKKLTISILFITPLIFFITKLSLAEKAKLTFTEQSMEIVISPDEHMAKIENDVSFKAKESVNEIKFLINKDIKVRKIEQRDKSLSYSLNKEFDITEYTGKSDSTLQDEYINAAELQISLPNSQTEDQFTLYYSLVASAEVDSAAFSREYIAYEVKGYIGKRGVFISPSYFWYPTLPNNLSHFDILISTPDTLQILTQGKLLLDEVIDNTRQTNWKIDYPANGLHLVGSEYIVQEKKYKDVSIYTYFFPESQDLAESYLNACTRYLAMYEAIIGPYPFSKFAVVENFFPTGYGMPSYTLLGSQVIRLPFIIYTSLGHEVAHNWWGNSVYIDYDSGNWCEGLTTYFADHYYKEMKKESEAALYRRDLNRDFTVYVKDQKDFPLSDFSERTESASRAIGYGKCALVFHQLRQIIGDSLFFKSFKTFYTNYKFKDASWYDIQKTAEQVSNQNLSWFFKQWIQRRGAPQIQLNSVHLSENQIEIILTQTQEELYRLYIPIEVFMNDSSTVVHRIWLEEQEQTFQLPVAGKAVNLTVDPYYDLLRKLEKTEIPPTLSEIFSKEEALLILPDNCAPEVLQNYQKFAETMSEGEEGMKIIEASNLSDSDLQNKSLYLLGTPSQNSISGKIQWDAELPFQIKNGQITIHGSDIPGSDDVAILVSRRPESGENVCIIAIGENQKTGRVANLISHYGKYSYLLFSDGKNKRKEIFPVSNSPMVYGFD